MNRLSTPLALGLFVAALGLVHPAAAQPEAPSRFEPLAVASGLHDGPALVDSTADVAARLAFEHTVQIPDAEWLRLRFARYRLGEGSYLLLTALEDGADQRLDAEALEAWRLQSAYFNGNAVTIALYLAPGDRGAFFELAEAEVGLPSPPPETICGTTDNRVASSDPAVGRMRTATGGLCTGWLTGSGAFLTAGHCSGLNVLEFNVPLSNANGGWNFSDPDDQYAINAFLFQAVPDPDDPGDTLVGEDWMVFQVAPNPNTGLLPGQAQDGFYRITNDSNPASLRITGHGTDGGTANATQQTSTGTNEGETFNNANWVSWAYRVDTEGGNSGSPVSLTDQSLSIGIHTHGGCTSTGGSNKGTSFESDDLAGAVDDFFGTDVVHLDVGHPIVTTATGTPFRPYKTVSAAVSGVPTGGVIRAVEGTYTVGASVYTKASEWLAPVGSVVLR